LQPEDELLNRDRNRKYNTDIIIRGQHGGRRLHWHC